MEHLYNNFVGYLQVNLYRIKWILLFGLLFFITFCFLQFKGYTRNYNKKIKTIVCGKILSLNCSFVFVVTLFGRRAGENYGFELMPFHSYYLAYVEGEVEILLQILLNIAMYIPIGFLLPSCFKIFEKFRQVTFSVVVISLCIELIQGVFKLGLFEVDDVINNTVGCMIGFSAWKVYTKGIRLYKNILNK